MSSTTYPVEVQDAYHWIKTFCHHDAVVGKDYQTIVGLTETDRNIAIQHLEVLRGAGLLVEGQPNKWQNFIVLDL